MVTGYTVTGHGGLHSFVPARSHEIAPNGVLTLFAEDREVIACFQAGAWEHFTVQRVGEDTPSGC
jgi:hypothetical protein